MTILQVERAGKRRPGQDSLLLYLEADAGADPRFVLRAHIIHNEMGASATALQLAGIPKDARTRKEDPDTNAGFRRQGSHDNTRNSNIDLSGDDRVTGRWTRCK